MKQAPPNESQSKGSEPVSGGSRWTDSFFVDFLGVFCIFFIYAGSAVPSVNEPHYWTKAAHFWNPAFAKGDLFLESGDAHWLFFATLGYLTQWFPLVWAVWIGRFFTWGLLALGWTMLGRALWQSKTTLPSESTASQFYAPLVASVWGLIWLVGLHWGHWAGEWVVGGCESKGIAYAMIFAGLAFAIQNRMTLAWTSLGVAAAFHVVTGLWVIVCVAFFTLLLDSNLKVTLATLRAWIIRNRLGWLLCSIGIIVGAVPAISIDWGIDPKLATESAVQQVYKRLGHHLAPSKFNDFRWQSFGVELLVAAAVFAALLRSTWPTAVAADKPTERFQGNLFASMRRSWVQLFVQMPRGMQAIVLCGLFAFGVALAGLAIDLILGRLNINLASKILRFYWFRWNDVAMPMMVGALMVAFAYGKLRYQPEPKMFRAVVWCGILIPGMMLLAYRFEASYNEKIPAGDKANFVLKADAEIDQVKQYQDWLRVCKWIRENTEPEGLWLTPRRQQSFKWHTGRPELACWKDAPQNAEAVVEWSKRHADAYKFDENKILQPITTEKIWELYKKYGIRYVLLDRRVVGQTPPLLPILYPSSDEFNENFAVFEIPQQQVNVSQ